MRRALRILLLIGALIVLAGAGFDAPTSSDPGQQFLPGNVQRQDTPNDPDYDQSEVDGAPSSSTNLFDERFDLFGFPSSRTQSVLYRDLQNPNRGKPQISGFNAAGAWKRTRGRDDVEVAILDTGINWTSGGVRDRVALNAGELPSVPDVDGDGLDVDDFAAHPRIAKAKPTGQDLIRAFSDGTDADSNGYVDDIAGWDFFDDDNDPSDASSYFAATNHGTGRTNEAVEKGNDAEGSLGVCPKCRHVPLRVWDTFVADQNNFALAIAYATDNGAEVIEGADGGLYHSAFAEQASRYAYERGVTQVYSGDDLNTGNHNYPAAYSHTMLIQGVVADVEGLGTNLPSNENDPGFRGFVAGLLNRAGLSSGAQPSTYFRNANTTQFGGKSSISMQGPTGSANTGKAAGAAALVISAARDRGIELTADETRILLEQTAEDVLPGDTTGAGVQDPAQPGFDTHFGYGRANVGEAVRAASDGTIPPEASIASPDWYAPLTGSEVRIRGLADDRFRRGTAFTWKLEYGVGLAPTEDEWVEVRSASSSAAVRDFGTIPLAEVRAALAARSDHRDRDDTGGPVLDPDPRLDPYQGQFAVRLTVTSANGAVKRGVDRKVLTALDDPTLEPGFPKRLGTGGEAPLRYSDLDGDNVQELVLPTEDGRVHAYRPDGSELPGWPVRTQAQLGGATHPGAPVFSVLNQPLEPPRGPVIVDLTGDGLPEVVTAAGERLYAWDARGRALPGWPIRPDAARANCAPSQQIKERSHPKCGFLATPAAARLDGPGKPQSIVAPGLDGRLYAYRADGSPQPGFPVRLIDTSVPEAERMTAESINNPAIGDLDGDGRDDIVVPTNEVYGGGGGSSDVSFDALLSGTPLTSSRVYAVGATGDVLDGWPIELSGVIQDILPLIGPGHDASLVRLPDSPRPQVVVSTTGGMLSIYRADGSKARDMQQNAGIAGGAFNLFESAAIGDLTGTGPDVVKYQVDAAQAANLALVGQNFPYSHRIGAFNAQTGAAKPGFPVITDDYQFLSSSTVVQVRPGATNQVIAGTGLGLLHAYDGLTGRDAPGFPKVTGGWLFSPAALSDDGRIAALTREGFLFEWGAPDAPACQTEWPSFRHDQQSTGNYDADGTPPATPEPKALAPLGGDRFRMTFRSPGDDGFCGTAKEYVADVDGAPVALGEPSAGGAEHEAEITVGAGATLVTIRARDEAGNLGPPAAFVRRPGPGQPFQPVPPGGNPADVPAFGAGGGGGGAAPGGGANPRSGAPGGGTPARPPTPLPPVRSTAKLEVARAGLRRRDSRLDVLAPITRRASGSVAVELRAAGRRIGFAAAIDAARGRVRFARRLLRRQARLGTGILTLRYRGDADTRPQVVRLRAASGRANLALGRPRIEAGRLQASGTVSRRARGVVRVQLEYDVAGATRTLEFKARIARGRWRLDTPLAAAVRSQIAARRGTVHSYTLFTGYLPARIRGEMRSFEVLPAR